MAPRYISKRPSAGGHHQGSSFRSGDRRKGSSTNGKILTREQLGFVDDMLEEHYKPPPGMENRPRRSPPKRLPGETPQQWAERLGLNPKPLSQRFAEMYPDAGITDDITLMVAHGESHIHYYGRLPSGGPRKGGSGYT
ncbi:MAG: hypothetical protein M1812_001559 [Candelaria pacifica]|nr:MAG: hypothetical protein M1812_001559 [Candelaria pacifica]